MRSTSAKTPLIVYLEERTIKYIALRSDSASLLTEKEHSRYLSITNPEIQWRYIAARAVQKLVLSALSKRDVRGISPYHDGATGKPLPVAGTDGVTWNFSISHTTGCSCLAFQQSGRVGVDVERNKPLKDPLRTARYAFSASEAAFIEQLGATRINSGFLRLWTRKEAMIKCCGGTVAHDMSHFSVPFDDTLNPQPLRDIRNSDKVVCISDINIHDSLFCSAAWDGAVSLPRLAQLHEGTYIKTHAAVGEGDYLTALSYIL